MAKYTKSLLIAIIILILSFIPLNTNSEGNFLNIPHIDKIGHFFFYALLGFMVLWESKIKREISFAGLLKIFLLLIVFGSLIEFGQYFHPLRTASWLDLIADLGGALSSAPLYFAFLRLRS